MSTLTEEQIKQIADELDCGFRCFWNKRNGELIFIPDELRHAGIEMEAWEDDIEKIDANSTDFHEIDQLETRDSFKIMAAFAESLEDSNNLKTRLIYALNRNKPFREFKFIIDNSGEYRQQWFDFKARRLQEWVVERLEWISRSEE